MIVDTSALVAILQNEPETRRLVTALAAATHRRLPVSCHLESFMRIRARYGDEGVRDLDLLVAEFRMEIVPFTESQARIARQAYRRYRMSFGDSMAYAAAKESGEELLFKSQDSGGKGFGTTDVAQAAY